MGRAWIAAPIAALALAAPAAAAPMKESSARQAIRESLGEFANAAGAKSIQIAACDRRTPMRIDCRVKISGPRVRCSGLAAVRYFARTGIYAVWLRSWLCPAGHH